MKLAALVATSMEVTGTRSRRKKVELLSDHLRQLSPSEISIGVSYLMGTLPAGKIGLGYAQLRAVSVEPNTTATLIIGDTNAYFERISSLRGPGSQAQRQQLLGDLLRKATRPEQEFLERLMLGELRQGALEGVMIDAISKAFGVPVSAVRRAVMLTGDPAKVAKTALLEGKPGLERCSLKLFRPIKPMLAQPAAAPEEALSRIGEAALEYKLDGARVQIHKMGGEVRIFTRHLNDVTTSVPELVESVARLAAEHAILDGEAIALDRDCRPLPFQITMQRFGRKLNVAEMRARIPLSAMYFDCLHLDGTDLIDESDETRFRSLCAIVPNDLMIPRLVTARVDEADKFLQQAIAAGHEGIMAKSIHASYQAGNRGSDWFKIKPSHSLDLVVLAAEWGSGRRHGKLSNLHLGARDPQTNTFVMLGKTFKGLTDAMLTWQTKELLAREIGTEDHIVHVRPELVVEVVFNELQRSTQYPAGMALRFARVKRYRQDKTAAEVDTLETVRAIFGSRFRDHSS